MIKPFVFNLSAFKELSYYPILTADNAAKMKSGVVTLHTDEEVGAHNTDNKEESIIVLQGKATIEIDGLVFAEVNEGSAAYFPSRTQHNIINRTLSDLRYVFITSQAE